MKFTRYFFLELTCSQTNVAENSTPRLFVNRLTQKSNGWIFMKLGLIASLHYEDDVGSIPKNFSVWDNQIK